MSMTTTTNEQIAGLAKFLSEQLPGDLQDVFVGDITSYYELARRVGHLRADLDLEAQAAKYGFKPGVTMNFLSSDGERGSFCVDCDFNVAEMHLGEGADVLTPPAIRLEIRRYMRSHNRQSSHARLLVDGQMKFLAEGHDGF